MTISDFPVLGVLTVCDDYSNCTGWTTSTLLPSTYGHVLYTPPAHASGMNLTTFGFTLIDVDTGAFASYTFSINVLNAPTPPAVTPSPAPVISPVPTGCDSPHPTTGSWICVGKTWISSSSVVTSDPLTVSSNIIVNGNLTAPVIILTNISTISPVNVSGCANVSSVQVSLTLQDAELIRGGSSSSNLTLLVQSGSNCLSIADLPISITLPANDNDACNKISPVPSSTSSSTLTVLFSVSNQCKGGSSWWIIVVALVGAVALIAIIFMVVVFTVKPVKHFFRPHARRTITEQNS